MKKLAILIAVCFALFACEKSFVSPSTTVEIEQYVLGNWTIIHQHSMIFGSSQPNSSIVLASSIISGDTVKFDGTISDSTGMELAIVSDNPLHGYKNIAFPSPFNTLSFVDSETMIFETYSPFDTLTETWAKD